MILGDDMLHKLKIPAIFFITIVVGGWVTSSIFNYYTFSHNPKVSVVGVDSDNYYSGILNCSLVVDNDYKVDRVELILDGEEFDFGNNRISSKKYETQFNLDTSVLSNGKHVLTINANDSSYHKNEMEKDVTFYVDNVPLKSAFIQPELKIDQGKTVYVRIQTNKKIKSAQIKFLSSVYGCYLDSEDTIVYESFIPIDCEEKTGEFLMTANVVDFVGNVIKLNGKVKIKQFDFPKQKGFKISKVKLDEEREVSMNNKILTEALKKWEKDSPEKKLWSGKFDMPTKIQWIATKYGEIRVTPERGRYYHKAIDIANSPKAVVWASQNGNIIIKDRYLMSGNTVVIDHGLGVFTLYYHLEDFAEIEVGDYVKKGNPVGQIGMTGYATGYHLHWELRVKGQAVDPVQWTQKTFLG